MHKKNIIIPLPSNDFDPSEAAVPWKILSDRGYRVFFATPNGLAAEGDEMMLSGEGLDPWAWIPFLKNIRLIGLMLRANNDGRTAYYQMIADNNFRNPCKYSDLKVKDYNGLFLAGGHASGIKQYLEDKTLQTFVADFFGENNRTWINL